jgi:hypothetical protein
MLPALLGEAASALPDRLTEIHSQGTRQVRAVTAPTRKRRPISAAAHPKEGGRNNRKGHALLSIYNLRLGGPRGRAGVDTQLPREGDPARA